LGSPPRRPAFRPAAIVFGAEAIGRVLGVGVIIIPKPAGRDQRDYLITAKRSRRAAIGPPY
jgi:hypothetical protein